MWTSGRVGRVLIARILPGNDLIETIDRFCREATIEQGVIQCCFGSLEKATVLWLKPQSEEKMGVAYTQPNVIEGPIEFLSAQGTIVPAEPKRLQTHMHGVFADRYGRVWGGHLVPGENPVLVTVEVVIAELVGVKLARGYDKDLGFPVLGIAAPHNFE